jgi:hypothetical protein
VADNLFGEEEEEVITPSVAVTEPFRTIYVHFERKEDIVFFSFLVDQVIHQNTRNLWYPAQESMSSIRFPDEKFDNTKDQASMFGDELWWEKYWQGMPEFISEDLTPLRTIYVHFMNQEAVDAFSALIEQELTELTRWVWYPDVEIQKVSDLRWVSKL